MKKSKSQLINEILEALRKNYSKYFNAFKEDLKAIEEPLYKWNYYEILGYYQEWKKGNYSLSMIVYILTGFEI